MSRRLSFEPRWWAVVIFFLTGLFLGYLSLFIWLYNGGHKFFSLRKIHGQSSFKYINPLLAVDIDEPKQFFNKSGLEIRLDNLINKEKKTKRVEKVAIYFRDIEPGRWIGINQDEKFSPGKLLTIPIMIAYFKQAEADPSILTRNLQYESATSSASLSDNNEMGLENGQTYSVEELIPAMITNNESAALALFDTVNKKNLNEVFSDLGIDFVEDKETDDFLAIKQYALVWRVLYNATYLNRDFSEKALAILSDTQTTVGIVGSLPNDIVTAHKFHSRRYEVNDGGKFIESHDCGIIYLPNHHYLLCAMAIGKDSGVVNNLLKEIGRLTYEDMANLYINH